jgi:hypothetical protein
LALLGGHLQELKFVECHNVKLVKELQTCTSLEALRLDSSTMEDLFDSNYNIPFVTRIKKLELEVDDEKMEEFLVFAAALKSESLTSLGINFIYSVPVSSNIFWEELSLIWPGVENLTLFDSITSSCDLFNQVRACIRHFKKLKSITLPRNVDSFEYLDGKEALRYKIVAYFKKKVNRPNPIEIKFEKCRF